MDVALKHSLDMIAKKRAQANDRLFMLVIFLCLVIAGLFVDRFFQSAALNQNLVNNKPQIFVMTPDKKTGAYNAITRLVDVDLTMLEATAYTEVTRYIQAYERYDKRNLLEYWNEVQVKSADSVFRQYAWRFNDENPNNLYKTVGDDILKVRFRSWLPAANGGMLVHYTVDREFVGDPQKTSSLNYVGRVHFEWKKEPAKFDDRVINGFGFHVTAFDVSLDNPTDIQQ